MSLYRLGSATSPPLGNICTPLTHPKSRSFDFPAYKQDGVVWISVSGRRSDHPNIDVGPSPFGISVFSTIVFGDHVWELPMGSEIPSEVMFFPGSSDHHLFGFQNDQIHSNAVDIMSAFGKTIHQGGMWRKVPKPNLPPDDTQAKLLAARPFVKPLEFKAIEHHVNMLKQLIEKECDEDIRAELHGDVATLLCLLLSHAESEQASRRHHFSSPRTGFISTMAAPNSMLTRAYHTSVHAASQRAPMYVSPLVREAFANEINSLKEELSIVKLNSKGEGDTGNEDMAAELYEAIAILQSGLNCGENWKKHNQ